MEQDVSLLSRFAESEEQAIKEQVRSLDRPAFENLLEELAGDFHKVLDSLNHLNLPDIEQVLDSLVETFSYKIGRILEADRSTLFVVDDNAGQLWSKVATGQGDDILEITLPMGEGLAGYVAETGETLNIPDAYRDERFNPEVDKKYGYRTKNILCMPLTNSDDETIAVVQLLNKQTADHFTEEDEELLARYGHYVSVIFDSAQKLFEVARNQRGIEALMNATSILAESLNLEKTLSTVMDEARDLLHAERSTLFLLDDETAELWSIVKKEDGSTMEVRIPDNKGIAGHVAQTGEILNIQDAYEDDRFNPEVDKKTGYRTKTILCMPVYNSDDKLIGVTQLINKKNGVFTKSDEYFMNIFNAQAGIALQNAKLFEEVATLQQYQKDILQSLSDAVIATKTDGSIKSINRSAIEIFGLEQEVATGKKIWEVLAVEKLQELLDKVINEGEAQYYPDQEVSAVADPEAKNPTDQQEQDVRNVNITINPLRNGGGSVYGTLLTLEDISQEKRMKSTLYRYMSQEVAEQIMSQKGESIMEGDRHEVSILFSDIRGYTQLTEELDAGEVVELLNEYFETMVESIFEYKGTVDKFIGDAIMAVFGAPLYLENHPWLCVQAALSMRHNLKNFNEKRVQDGKSPISIGIGISSDIVVSGNIGSSKRMDYTAIGDGVNMSARLESITKLYGCDIIISEYTQQKLPKDVALRELDLIRVKGKTVPMKIFEVIGGTDYRLTKQEAEFQELFEQANELYRKGSFNEADALFKQAQSVFNHPSCDVFIKRCEHMLNNPQAAEDWDGVWTMQTK